MLQLKRIMKLAGKDDFVIDERIDGAYIFRLCVKYGFMKLRGIVCSLGYKNISKSIFVGKRVNLLGKRYMQIGDKVKLHDSVEIDGLSENGVIIKEKVVLGKNTTIACTGSLRCIGKGIRIGARTTFGADCFFGAAGGIEIGEDVVAGQQIRFHSENHNYSDVNRLIKEQGVCHKGIKVGNNCWIGAGAVFLDGAEIGDGCVVAANAVVTKKFGNDLVIGGVPAKIIAERNN